MSAHGSAIGQLEGSLAAKCEDHPRGRHQEGRQESHQCHLLLLRGQQHLHHVHLVYRSGKVYCL